MAYTDYLPEWDDLWAKADMSPEKFFRLAVKAKRLDILDYEREVAALGMEPDITWYLLEPELEIPYPEIPPAYVEPGEPAGPPPPLYLESKIASYFRDAFREVLVSLWQWTINKLKDLIDLVVGTLGPVLNNAWEFTRAKFEESGRTVYDYAQKMFEGHSELVPDDAPPLALKLYGFAMGAGMAAHGAALATELLHPLKRIGLHTTAAAIGDFAGFGRICGATMGTLVNKVLGQLMTYNVQDRCRPIQPNDMQLQIMAVKPDISIEKFRKGMAYMGYSEDWINAIQKTMYHEPRYFELKMMSEDEAATDEWLRKKSRRAGFTEEDTDVMVRSYVKQAARTQRGDFYKQGFYMYKEGYVTKERFEQMIDDLELRPEAKTFGTMAAELAYLNDYTKDMISLYTDSFLKDLIDDDELLVSLLSLGMTPQRAWLLTAKARVRKRPKPARVSTKAAEKAASDMQKKHVTLYITQYRKDLITADRLLESLLAIGLELDLALVTVSLESAKKGVLVPTA